MGVFRYPLEVLNSDGTRVERLEAWVDSGASYTWVPGSLFHRLGHVSVVRRQFKLADGCVVERDMAQAPVRFEGQQLMTLCVFGDEGSEPLLGVVTVEEFALGIDPVNRRLVPMISMMLMTSHVHS
ncbi:MAG: hypothetical protein EXR55_02400 [Dehalococcoidia bacterium]|nr:hypothetical protein [Dehalococcoidia bacterium]